MLKSAIIKFYDAIFLDDKHKSEEIPYGNKVFMFWFSLASFSIVGFFIVKEVLKNIQ
jgi:hypothetical protein